MTRPKIHPEVLLFTFCFFFFARPSQAAARVEIRNGWFYVDGSPFYVKGVGYAPWRPHQHPGVSYAGVNHRWTQMDFERIKAAHFNTIRTWEALEPEELALAQASGLWVLQGIRLDPRQDFSDARNQASCLAQVRQTAEQSKAFDNVLGYLVMNDPWPQGVEASGQENTRQFFRRLKRAIQEIDPRPVSMESWMPLAFFDDPDFDFAAFDAFAFWPPSIQDSLGLAGTVRWLADHFAAGRPLLIGETGGYAVSRSSSGAAGGYGGLSEYDQSVADLESLRSALQGHAQGSVLVSWIDTWHYPQNPDVHDDDPWEWDGLLAIATDRPKDMDGVPRQIYRDVTRYNEVILVEPKADHFYGLRDAIAVQVYGAPNVARVRYSLNGEDWRPVENAGQGWWQTFFKLPALAKNRQHLAIQALDSDDRVLETKDVSFLAALSPEQVDIQPGGGAGLAFTIQVSRGNHRPIPGRKVTIGFFYPLSQRESESVLTTDAGGRIRTRCALAPRVPEDDYLYVSAGTSSPENVRAGDLRIFRLGR